MAVDVAENELLLRCACGDRMAHVAWLIHEPDDSLGNNLKGEQDDWYLMIGLDCRFGFWRRLWTSLKYAFWPSSLTAMRYHGYSELVLRNEDIDRLNEFIVTRRLPAALHSQTAG